MSTIEAKYNTLSTAMKDPLPLKWFVEAFTAAVFIPVRGIMHLKFSV